MRFVSPKKYQHKKKKSAMG